MLSIFESLSIPNRGIEDGALVFGSIPSSPRLMHVARLLRTLNRAVVCLSGSWQDLGPNWNGFPGTHVKQLLHRNPACIHATAS